MRELIENNLNNPEELEKLYRKNKKVFEAEFLSIYPEKGDSIIADYWLTRFKYDKPTESKFKPLKNEVYLLLAIVALTGLLIRIPDIFKFSPEKYYFYERNSAIIVFLGMSLFFIISTARTSLKNVLITLALFLISALYINLLPFPVKSQTIDLAYIHLPLILWCFYGLVFSGFEFKNKVLRMDYIKYNGELATLGAVIVIGGFAFSAMTMGLFDAIGMNIENFYMKNIGIWGIASAPVVTAFFVKNYPGVADKIAPVIARIFSPVVLITMIIFLISIIITGKDPYNDRDFLLLFNLMLIGVMAIIVYSITGISAAKKNRFNNIVLFLLAAITLVVDIIALSAIVYRLGEFGFSPNRLAVLGSNILIFIHLGIIAYRLFSVNFRNMELKIVEDSIASYLPVYAFWTVLVVFGFPLIFWMA